MYPSLQNIALLGTRVPSEMLCCTFLAAWCQDQCLCMYSLSQKSKCQLPVATSEQLAFFCDRVHYAHRMRHNGK